ncbi:hypothetical protein FI667_g11620, partial [Globisporangium splendens]
MRRQPRSGRWVATAHDKAFASDPSADKKPRDAIAAQSDDDAKNPWSHFQAFSGMDEYMDVTLIQYKNDESTRDKADANDQGDATAPSRALSPEKKDNNVVYSVFLSLP